MTKNSFVAEVTFKAMMIQKKEGKTEIQKFEHLEDEKCFLDEIKSFFHNYLRTIIC